MKARSFRWFALILLLSAVTALAQDLASFEKRVVVKTLPNGLTVLVMNRPEAPVFSFFTHVDAGSAQDPSGSTGLAHMFEHMAFKGTDKIGTTDFPAEKAALEKVERAYAAYNSYRHQDTAIDNKKLEALKKAWEDAMAEAQKYVVENQFGKIVEQNGGEGLNAFTSMDETGYMYSFPTNRLQLWAYLESERFMHPVFREFYKERDVVYEERRMRVDSQPVGRMVEQFLSLAFTAHPYHNEGVGWPSDLESFSATDAANFYKHYYVPANMVVAVVGDVQPNEVVSLVEKYFGRLPGEPKPPDLRTVEPPQVDERSALLRDPSQPMYLEGYHRPNSRDPDSAVYDVIADLMSKGRTSRLYESLVRDKKLALDAQGGNYFPGDKYPNLFYFFAIPNRNIKPDQLREAVHEEIDKIKNQDVSDEELKSVKTRARADLIRSLADNEGMAQNLATFQARFGDWRELFRQLDKYDKVTKQDIRRVANRCFVQKNRTQIVMETAPPPGAAEGSTQQQQQQENGGKQQ